MMKISQGAKEKILKSVENLEERLVQTVSEMVQIKSINPGFGVEDKDNEGGETRVNEYTKKIMEGMGLETDFFSVAEDRFNLVGTYKSEGNGKSLLFNGHVDVVPPSGNDWIYDPSAAR
jgi:acetylornithine deacetylase/succinyl-diaminopimelate desuccinylase-like protein